MDIPQCQCLQHGEPRISCSLLTGQRQKAPAHDGGHSVQGTQHWWVLCVGLFVACFLVESYGSWLSYHWHHSWTPTSCNVPNFVKSWIKWKLSCMRLNLQTLRSLFWLTGFQVESVDGDGILLFIFLFWNPWNDWWGRGLLMMEWHGIHGIHGMQLPLSLSPPGWMVRKWFQSLNHWWISWWRVCARWNISGRRGSRKRLQFGRL